jgi:hypothetical protein
MKPLCGFIRLKKTANSHIDYSCEFAVKYFIGQVVLIGVSQNVTRCFDGIVEINQETFGFAV